MAVCPLVIRGLTSEYPQYSLQIEDAAVFGNLFSRITCVSQVEPLLRAYQELRLPRATATYKAAWANRETFHLPDGEAQRLRDASMHAAMKIALEEAQRPNLEPNANSGNANIWADKAKNMEQFSYDADEATARWWNENGWA